MAPKRKLKEIQTNNKKAKSTPIPKSESGPSPDDLARRIAWDREIKTLIALEPTSIEQGISMLIDSVVGKMGVPAAAQGQTKEFLQGLFDTDPALKDLVKVALKL